MFTGADTINGKESLLYASHICNRVAVKSHFPHRVAQYFVGIKLPHKKTGQLKYPYLEAVMAAASI